MSRVVKPPSERYLDLLLRAAEASAERGDVPDQTLLDRIERMVVLDKIERAIGVDTGTAPQAQPMAAAPTEADIGCPNCGTVVKVPLAYGAVEILTGADGEQMLHVPIEPDLADLWAHAWTCATEKE